jgi:hypothetical protein
VIVEIGNQHWLIIEVATDCRSGPKGVQFSATSQQYS